MAGRLLVTPPVAVTPDVGHFTLDGAETLCGLAIERSIEHGAAPPLNPDGRRIMPGTWYSHRARAYYGRMCTACIEADRELA